MIQTSLLPKVFSSLKLRTINLAVRISFIIKPQFPDLPNVTEEQVERLQAPATSIGLLLALLLIINFVIASPAVGAEGMIAAIITYTNDMFNDQA
ncbi:hypothetical protein BKP56_04580 [Marinilactibacillus sp. 15R]|uniref:hypothetical protein n=1 Tax=Marinilactibacillus sp. 15R TaxID=1911586 RepID=UPI000909663C|nr:hypothetical protein [Marinilactibacillus sp. 15R]API88619.1 hypothetical protein BKP56_04580 [Marinilactibacillus sp. 15R]